MYSPKYEPKKNKIKWNVIIPVLLITLVLIISGIYLINNTKKQNEDSYGICGFNNIKTRNIVHNSEDKIKISDYLFYGETLNLFSEPFEFGAKDDFYGKTVSLVNLCTGLDYVYMLESKVDGQIPLEGLEPGFYSVHLNKDLKLYQMFFENEVNDVFYTTTRDNANLKIELIANKHIFDDENQTDAYLDENYFYIKVTQETAPSDYYDIVIDPGHLTRDSGWLERGITSNGLIESEETYKMALELKKEFEANGFRVFLTRDDESIVNSYGIDGRLYRAYNSKSKYYIDIQLKSSSNTTIRGTQVVYSSYSSNKLANSILSSLVNSTNLIATDYRGSGNVFGVIPSVLADGFDGRMMIRESGGKILGAGKYSQKSSEENGSFNAENRYGMQTITIEYAYISNQEDYDVWVNDKNNVAKATVNGFKKYLGIK